MTEFYLKRGAQGEEDNNKNSFAHSVLTSFVSAAHAEAGGYSGIKKRNPRNPADLINKDFGDGERMKLMQTSIVDGVIDPFTVVLTTKDRVLVAGVDEDGNRAIQNTEFKGIDAYYRVILELFGV